VLWYYCSFGHNKFSNFYTLFCYTLYFYFFSFCRFCDLLWQSSTLICKQKFWKEHPMARLAGTLIQIAIIQFISTFICMNLYQTSQPSGCHSWFLFGRSRVQISAQRPSIMIEAFHFFPQYQEAGAGIVSKIRSWPLPSTSFPIHFINHPIFHRYVVWATDSVVK
jgi:hypothetical protein